MSTFRRRLTQRYSAKTSPKISDTDAQAQAGKPISGKNLSEISDVGKPA